MHEENCSTNFLLGQIFIFLILHFRIYYFLREKNLSLVKGFLRLKNQKTMYLYGVKKAHGKTNIGTHKIYVVS